MPTVLDAERFTFGQMLRLAREHRRLTLEQVSATTNIPLAHLEAFERDEFAGTAPGMYQRAEIRAIADAVGLDARTALIAAERPAQPRVDVPPPVMTDVAPSVTTDVAPAVTPELAPSVMMDVAPAATTEVAPPVTTDVAPMTSDVTPATLHMTPPAAPAPIRVASPKTSAAANAPRRVTKSSVRGAAAVAALAVIVLALAWAMLRSPADTDPTREEQPASVGASAAPQPAASRVAQTPSTVPPTAASASSSPTVGRADAAAGRDDAASAPPISPSLRVITEPAGARVTVDGVGWGQTPITIRYLPPGQKRVRVTHDGYVTREQIVAISPDQAQTIVRLSLQRRR